jgi:hypothetical protein
MEKVSPHFLAQRLNHKAAYCIETGRFDKAIANLVKAMQYCKNDQSTKVCTCDDCTLQACVEYSHSLVQHNKLQSSEPRNNHSCDSVLPVYFSDEDQDDDYSYLYRVPLLTPPDATGHSMGLVLPKVITFNLALAHQLKALNDNDNNRFKVVSRLYQLVYNNEIKNKNKASLFIALVAANNLSDIHRRLHNKLKHEHCLRFVLSAVMLLGYDSAGKRKYYNVELKGFFRNAASLILKPTCAAVA